MEQLIVVIIIWVLISVFASKKKKKKPQLPPQTLPKPQLPDILDEIKNMLDTDDRHVQYIEQPAPEPEIVYEMEQPKPVKYKEIDIPNPVKSKRKKKSFNLFSKKNFINSIILKEALEKRRF